MFKHFKEVIQLFWLQMLLIQAWKNSQTCLQKTEVENIDRFIRYVFDLLN